MILSEQRGGVNKWICNLYTHILSSYICQSMISASFTFHLLISMDHFPVDKERFRETSQRASARVCGRVPSCQMAFFKSCFYFSILNAPNLNRKWNPNKRLGIECMDLNWSVLALVWGMWLLRTNQKTACGNTDQWVSRMKAWWGGGGQPLVLECDKTNSDDDTVTAQPVATWHQWAHTSSHLLSIVCCWNTLMMVCDDWWHFLVYVKLVETFLSMSSFYFEATYKVCHKINFRSIMNPNLAWTFWGHEFNWNKDREKIVCTWHKICYWFGAFI